MNRQHVPDPVSLLILSFRIILGAMFVYAGVLKISDPAGFAQAIANYHILPVWLAGQAAIILPWVELLAGASLILGLFLEGGSLIIAGLLLVFSCALAFDLWRGLDISCGCFGSSTKTITWLYVLRDALLFGMACLVLRSSRKSPFSIDNLRTGGKSGN
jgi:uncharacterized membrane protein YphA (DoxX/SURF4 family)